MCFARNILVFYKNILVFCKKYPCILQGISLCFARNILVFYLEHRVVLVLVAGVYRVEVLDYFRNIPWRYSKSYSRYSSYYYLAKTRLDSD